MGRKTMVELGLLGLYTETPLHCGAESTTGYVDLPIQRERHTLYPVVPGSTLKGVLRDEVRGPLDGDTLDRYFGTEDATTPGRVSFGDGQIVAFPVRSSEAPFHWVTCPFVLERLGRSLAGVPTVRAPEPGQAWAREAGEILLEELRLERVAHPAFFGEGETPGPGIEALRRLLPGAEAGFDYTREILPARLLVVRDEAFRELVEVGTEVRTRIKLNLLGTTDTLKRDDPRLAGMEPSDQDLQGNLFVQELVPPETLFAAPLRALEDASAIAESLAGLPVIRIGGDESIGRGLTHLSYVAAGEGGAS